MALRGCGPGAAPRTCAAPTRPDISQATAWLLGDPRLASGLLVEVSGFLKVEEEKKGVDSGCVRRKRRRREEGGYVAATLPPLVRMTTPKPLQKKKSVLTHSEKHFRVNTTRSSTDEALEQASEQVFSRDHTFKKSFSVFFVLANLASKVSL